MTLLSDGGLDQNAFYAIMGVGVCTLIYMLIRPKLRKNKDPFDKPFKTRSLAQQRSVERQMETLLVELADMSRQMSAQLETRAVKLELLLKEADGKIAELQSLSQRSYDSMPQQIPQARVIDESLAVPSPVVPLPPIVAEPMMIDPQHAEIYRRIDAGQNIPEIASAMNRPNGEIQLILALRSSV